jgi:nicotinamide mononucleotide transporter
MTWIEAIATFFGILSVWLTIRQRVWCWPTGLVQVFLYIFIFYDAKLYADVVLHVIYVALCVYGWISWSDPKASSFKVGNDNNMITWILVITGGTALWGYSLATFTDASVPYLDSFVVMASLVAQWLTAKKKLQSWYFWIIADILAVGVYAYKQLYFSSGLYLVFLVMAVAGYFAWRKALRNDDAVPGGILTT